jgi:hypothetical protein
MTYGKQAGITMMEMLEHGKMYLLEISDILKFDHQK